ncbi:hypothetical protein ACNO7I_10390, partial [Bisgaard Taxon 45]
SKSCARRSRQVIHQVCPYDRNAKKPLSNPQIHNATKSAVLLLAFSQPSVNGTQKMLFLFWLGIADPKQSIPLYP